MSFFIFLITHFVFLGLLAAVSYLVGLRLTRRVVYHSGWEEFSVCVSLGLGVLAYVVLLLGLVGLLYSVAVLIAIAALVVLAYPVWTPFAQRLKSLARQARSRVLIIAAVVLVLTLPIGLLPLYPPTAWDSTEYHLASAKVFVQNHRVVFTPHLRYAVFTQTNHMLFVLAILLHDDVSAHLVQFLMMLALAAGVTAFGRRFFSERAGWWSAAILLSSPMTLWLGASGVIDMSLMLFSAMSVYTFWNWRQKREQHCLMLAGVFCGFAMSTKYPAIFFLIALGGVALWVSLKERSKAGSGDPRPSEGNGETGIRRFGRSAERNASPIAFGVIALAVASPWYVRNFYYTSNPFHPFYGHVFNRWFGYGKLTPPQGPPPVYKPPYSTDKSFRALAMLPMNVTFNQHLFHLEAPLSSTYHLMRVVTGSKRTAFYCLEALLSLTYLLALPLMLVVGLATRHIRGLLLLGLAFVLFWFATEQAMRYLMPAIPLLSVAMAAAIDRFLERSNVPTFQRSNVQSTAFIFAALIAPGWLYAVYTVREQGRIPVTQEQRDVYLTQRALSPTYPAYKLLNDLKGQNYTVYSLYDENMTYFADGDFRGDWFGDAQYARVESKLADGRKLYDELKSMEANYFLVTTHRRKVKLPQDEFFRSHFKRIYARESAMVFELSEKPLQVNARAR